MKETIYIIIFIIVFYIVFLLKNDNLVEFIIDGDSVYVRKNNINKEECALVLNKIIDRMFKLKNYLVNNIDKFKNEQEYIQLLNVNFTRTRTKIYETDFESSYTSYAINKGEEIALCLRCKNTGNIHNINLLMYVAVHEMAHTACPENGHTPLFNNIFRFMLEQAVKIGLYRYEDYSRYPVVYCGMKLYTNILN